VTQARDFLGRFRPAGAPGSAARAGVPADRAAELAAEVEPLLTLLDGTNAECERITADARLEADRIMAEARAEVAVIGEEADRNARAARDEAAAEVLARARAEAEETAARAGQQAARIRRLAQRRLPGLVAAAVSEYLPLAAAQDGAATRDTAAAQDDTVGPPMTDRPPP
jgi:vacuolar-type H+-ATPase subunit H